MMKYVRNQEGIALIAALLLLVTLTVMGLAAMMTSTVEESISGNDRLSKTTFYTAEGGARAALTWLRNVWSTSGGLAPVNNYTDNGNLVVRDPVVTTNYGDQTANLGSGSYTFNLFSLTENETQNNVPAAYKQMTRMPGPAPKNYSMTTASGYGGDDSNVRAYYYGAQVTGTGPRNSLSSITVEFRYYGEAVDN